MSQRRLLPRSLEEAADYSLAVELDLLGSWLRRIGHRQAILVGYLSRDGWMERDLNLARTTGSQRLARALVVFDREWFRGNDIGEVDRRPGFVGESHSYRRTGFHDDDFAEVVAGGFDLQRCVRFLSDCSASSCERHRGRRQRDEERSGRTGQSE